MAQNTFEYNIISKKVAIEININKNVEQCLDKYKNQFANFIEEQLKKLISIRIKLIISVKCDLKDENLTKTEIFESKPSIVCVGNDIKQEFMQLINEFNEFISKLKQNNNKCSGWQISKNFSMKLKILRYNPLQAENVNYNLNAATAGDMQYLELPNILKWKKALINVQNKSYSTRDKCFVWCVCAHLNNEQKNPQRVTKYKQYAKEHKYLNIDKFPVELQDISKFESKNKISINVFGFVETPFAIVGPLYKTKKEQTNHINLLLIIKNNKRHFCLIKNFSRLLGLQKSLNEHFEYHCNSCLNFFRNPENIATHRDSNCGELIKDFYDYKLRLETTLEVPFVIYFDFVTLVFNDSCYYSYSYYIKCSFNNKINRFKQGQGDNDNIIVEFIDSLTNDAIYLYNKYLEPVEPINMTPEAHQNFETTKECCICNKTIESNPVRHHNHVTGKYFGPAHNNCNLRCRLIPYFPCISNNLSKQCLNKLIEKAFKMSTYNNFKINLAKTKKYMSFSIILNIENNDLNKNNKNITLKFMDFSEFLAWPIKLMERELNNDFIDKNKKHLFSIDQKAELAKSKPFFPFLYFTSKQFELFTQNIENNSLHDFWTIDCRIKKMWEMLECKTIKDYLEQYLKFNVLYFLNIFERFRAHCFSNYNVDPVHYSTVASFAWNVMLKHTNIKVNCALENKMMDFIKTSKPDPSASLPLDVYVASSKQSVINAYNSAMSDFLPYDEFKWEDNKPWNLNNILGLKKDNNSGYMFEVDLECSKHIMFEKSILKNIILSANFIDNVYQINKIVLHYRVLQLILHNKFVLKKVYRVLSFKQAAWLKPYVELNNKLENYTNDVFEKKFYIVMNQIIVGKSMENFTKYVNLVLVDKWKSKGKSKGAEALISQADFRDVTKISKKLVIVHKQVSKYYKMPNYKGYTVWNLAQLYVD